MFFSVIYPRVLFLIITAGAGKTTKIDDLT